MLSGACRLKINEISVFVIRITFGNMCVGVKPFCLATDVACEDKSSIFVRTNNERTKVLI